MRSFHRALRQAAVAAFSLLAGVASATTYQVNAFSAPGATQTEFWDINNSGQIVGGASADGVAFSSFIYNEGSYTMLSGPSGATSSVAFGISDSGVVVGEYYAAGSAFAAGYIYENGTYITLSLPAGPNTTLRGVSPDGRYVSGTTEDYDTGIFNGFLLDRNTNAVVTFDGAIVKGINDAGILVGSVLGGNPFTYDIGTGVRTDFTLHNYRFRDIDHAGNITGWYYDPSLAVVGIAGKPGSFDLIDMPFGDVEAFGNNDAGFVVGTMVTYDQDWNVFESGFIASPVGAVPEPQTYALMLVGLVAIGAAARRRGR